MKRLESPRLNLRALREGDEKRMFECWCSDPEVPKFLPWTPHASVEDTKKVLANWIGQMERGERFHWGMELKSDGTLIGNINVVGYLGGVSGTPVIGYCMAKRYWNNGYMTEACKSVLELLFSRGYAEVRIDALPENKGSIRVIEKCGGVYVKTEIEDVPQKNIRVPVNRYIVKAK